MALLDLPADGREGSSDVKKYQQWAALGLSREQRIALGLLATLSAGLLIAIPVPAIAFIHSLIVFSFAANALSKLVLAAIGTTSALVNPIRRNEAPPYTVLVPLYREGAVAHQLIVAMSAINYPSDRLQILLILEQDDRETLDALACRTLPSRFEVLIKPPGGPRTKPNALNFALSRATGEFVVVYDAEDIPDPAQLLEAAARFRADPDLDCLQAPLRISNTADGFVAQQFALEYAAQFDGVIPGLVRLGLAFPLGGTSNHLRTTALRQLGGWDPYNVTEDADLGLRLGVEGRRVGLLAAPTFENAPCTMADWLPQRSRWVKGYMQTWGVQMRRPFAGGLEGFLLLQATLGVAIMGAALHGPLILLLDLAMVGDIARGAAPAERWADLSILTGGWAATVVAMALGAVRAGRTFGPWQALACLGYWPLQTLAFASAVYQLATDPHRWDKTAHTPVDAPPLDGTSPWSVSPAA